MHPTSNWACCLTAALTLLAALAFGGDLTANDTGYDPASVKKQEVLTKDLTVHERARSRQIPVRVYRCDSAEPSPVILFSHGLGGSREGASYLGRHWAGRGYVVVVLQHPGSDESVWRTVPLRDRMTAMRAAANGENLQLRIGDVAAVLDQLPIWDAEPDHPLAGRLDLDHVGMSGHSFGAVTTQAVSGQAGALGRSPTDARIDAAVILSPSGPRSGITATAAFRTVTKPWLLMTGTNDVAAIGGETVASRLSVFPALPPGGKYELLLDGAAHSAFSDERVAVNRSTRNPNHHPAILAISTAFWDAYLRDDPQAKAWLDGAGPKSVLESADRWQRK